MFPKTNATTSYFFFFSFSFWIFICNLLQHFFFLSIPLYSLKKPWPPFPFFFLSIARSLTGSWIQWRGSNYREMFSRSFLTFYRTRTKSTGGRRNRRNQFTWETAAIFFLFISFPGGFESNSKSYLNVKMYDLSLKRTKEREREKGEGERDII